MSAGTHAANNQNGKPKRQMIWIFGGAATAVIVGGLLMQYLRATPSQAADNSAGTVRVGSQKPPAAKIGNELITRDALADECIARYGREVLDDMIHRMIITQACERQNITVTEQEVSQEITRIAKRFQLDVDQYLKMLQTERNVTPMQYRSSVIWPMLALKKLAGEDVEISEQEMQKAFERNYGERVKARVIMFDNVRRANEIWDMAKKDPDSFEKLAQDHSIDPNSRALGGQVPPIPRHTGIANDKLEKEAFRMKEGDISGIIEIAQSRYVILKCEGRTTPVVTDIEEVRDSLYDELKEAKTQQAVGKTFEKIKENTRVDNYYTRTTSGPEAIIPVGGTAPAGSPNTVQPAGSTQVRSPRANGPATAPATTTAPARTTRN